MSSVQENFEVGYDENRFQGRVRRDLICSICHDVLRDPRICQNKEHPFCVSCILRHLQDSPTCPVCREGLTPKTLKPPTRFFMNCLLELNINCDYNNRGCPDYVQLGNLRSHVDHCGFAPVMCGNEGCGIEINRRDKENHEKNFCQFRIAKCHDCRDIKASQNKVKARQDEMKGRQSEMKASQDEMKASQDQMKARQEEAKQTLCELKASQGLIKGDLDEVKRQMNEVTRKQEQMDARIRLIDTRERQLQESVEVVKQTQAEMKKEMRQQFGVLTDMMRQILTEKNVNNSGAQAMDPAVPLQPTTDQAIIIIGGYDGPGDDDTLSTVEMLDIVEGKSVPLPAMNKPRSTSASCLYNNDVIVAGGFDGQSGIATVEILKMNQRPLRWVLHHVMLPVKLSSHDVIVYLDKLFVIGGYDWNAGKTSDAIYEVSLAQHSARKLVIRMPQARRNHRAELVNGQLFILGGRTTAFSKNATDSVLVYDAKENLCKPCPPLPRPVFGMSTVTWGNMIILVGGMDKDGHILNEVIMYDTETGRSERLPSMIYKRRGCSAVIINDVMVVAGGWNKEQRHLKSVECLTIGSGGWKELPEMKEKRTDATAVVKPRN